MKPTALMAGDPPSTHCALPSRVAGTFTVLPIAASRPAHARGASRQASGVAVSVALHLGLALTFLIGARRAVEVIAPPPAPIEVSLIRAAPPSPPEEVAPGPRQVERRASPPPPPTPLKPREVQAEVEPLVAAPVRPAEPSDPGPPAPRTTAPPTVEAPAAPRVSSNIQSTWEGQLLARLETFRRYPSGAQAQRRQGVAHVRFAMNREGRVLWARLQRSSGVPELDRGALDTLRRAQPLPKPPSQVVGEVIELVVPVEFYLR